MVSQRTIESFVGLFLLAGILALITLAFKVSGLTTFFQPTGYDVTAQFEDIGQLKVRGPVKIGGVLVGEVTGIALDRNSFKAVVTMHINSKFNDIPDDSSASIVTAGLLGDNYIAITPMYSTVMLKQGANIQDTHSAMILEKLIGQLIYKLSNPAGSTSTATTNTATDNNAAQNNPAPTNAEQNTADQNNNNAAPSNKVAPIPDIQKKAKPVKPEEPEVKTQKNVEPQKIPEAEIQNEQI